MLFLIGHEPGRLSERNNHDGDAAAVEFGFGERHLAEVGLARKSCEVTKKDQQRGIDYTSRKFDRIAAKI